MINKIIFLAVSFICINGFGQGTSSCIGNLGTPNTYPATSASSGGYIPLGSFGAQNVFSISMWIKPGQTQHGIAIIIDASHGGSSNWVIQTLNSGSTWTWGSGVFSLSTSEWQHLLLTYDNGNRKIFVNGIAVQSWFQSISYSGSPSLYLGNWPEGGRRFNGLVDELYIVSTILETENFTPSEIIASPAPTTFGLWHFDEGSGLNTNNSTGTSFPLNTWYWDNRELNNSNSNNSISSNSIPAAISYQAAARNIQGEPIIDTEIQVRFTLLTDSLTGAAEYTESHSLTTNSLGLFTTAFGAGTPDTGTFAGINWASGNKYLKVEIDAGSGFVDMGSQQLMSVPYALQAKKSTLLENNSLPVFPDNAAALSGGLQAGQMYRTATGDLKIVY
jgi:hypothetical protein